METRDDEDLALRHYAAVLWRRKLQILAVVVLAVGIGLLLVARQERRFESTVQILLQPQTSEELFAPGSGSGEATGGGRDSELSTEIAVMSSRSVKEAVEDEVDGPLSVEIVAVEGSQVLAITASASKRERAMTVAQAYADTYVSIRRERVVQDLLGAIDIVQAEIATVDEGLAQFDEPLSELDGQLLGLLSETTRRALEAQREEVLARRQPFLSRKAAFEEEVDQLRLASNLAKTGGAQIIGDASDAQLAGELDLRRALSAALALGLVVGIVFAFSREHLGDKVVDSEGLAAQTGQIPVLALVPHFSRLSKRRNGELVANRDPRSTGAEAYRRLRTATELASPGSVHTLLVTSPSPGDGKSMTVANLAVTLARSDRRVVVIDADLRRPWVHRYFDLSNDKGVTSVISGTCTIGAAVQSVPGVKDLRVITAGPPVDDPTELLAHREIVDKVFRPLKHEADIVLVDGPPLLPVIDALALAGDVDALMLVARAGRTRQKHLVAAYDLLQQVRTPLVGTVLNATKGKAVRDVYGYGMEKGGLRRRPARHRQAALGRRRRRQAILPGRLPRRLALGRGRHGG